eukprot:1154313-Pelagomonas_calceolata.AAC.6
MPGCAQGSIQKVSARCKSYREPVYMQLKTRSTKEFHNCFSSQKQRRRAGPNWQVWLFKWKPHTTGRRLPSSLPSCHNLTTLCSPLRPAFPAGPSGRRHGVCTQSVRWQGQKKYRKRGEGKKVAPSWHWPVGRVRKSSESDAGVQKSAAIPALTFQRGLGRGGWAGLASQLNSLSLISSVSLSSLLFFLLLSFFWPCHWKRGVQLKMSHPKADHACATQSMN